MQVDRANFTAPSIGVVIQVWSLIGATWTQTCADRMTGSKETNRPSGIACGLRGGTQTRVRFVTAGNPSQRRVLFRTR